MEDIIENAVNNTDTEKFDHIKVNQANIKVIGVNYKDDSQKTIAWLKELGNPYAVIAVDMNGSIGLDWGVYGLPETFITNNKGKIIFKHLGLLTEKDLKNEIYDLLQ